MKTYLDKLMEDKGYSESFKKEYRELKISEFRAMLKDIEAEYKDDPQRLKLFSMGIKRMIRKLKG